MSSQLPLTPDTSPSKRARSTSQASEAYEIVPRVKRTQTIAPYDGRSSSPSTPTRSSSRAPSILDVDNYHQTPTTDVKPFTIKSEPDMRAPSEVAFVRTQSSTPERSSVRGTPSPSPRRSYTPSNQNRGLGLMGPPAWPFRSPSIRRSASASSQRPSTPLSQPRFFSEARTTTPRGEWRRHGHDECDMQGGSGVASSRGTGAARNAAAGPSRAPQDLPAESDDRFIENETSPMSSSAAKRVSHEIFKILDLDSNQILLKRALETEDPTAFLIDFKERVDGTFQNHPLNDWRVGTESNAIASSNNQVVDVDDQTDL